MTVTFEIKKQPSPNLKIPTFLCDGGVNPNLENYPSLSHLNGFKFTGLIGVPGSGKTSLLVSWLTGKGKNQIFRKVFDNVYLVMPTTSRNSMSKNIFEKHDQDKMFDELDLANTDHIYNQLLKNSEEKETSLLLLDDIAASLKNKEIQKLLRKIVYNRRHCKVHIVVLLQSFIAIPKEIRKLFDNVVIFKPSKVEFQNLFDELFECHKDKAIDIMNLVYDEPHNYMFLNVPSQKMYKKYDEIIIHDTDEENKILQ